MSETSLAARLGLNRSTAALLAAILLIGMGQELWSPFMPKFIEKTIEDLQKGNATIWGLSAGTAVILIVGLYGTWRDFQEGVYYYLGGRLGGSLGTRTALVLFSALPLVGYGMILAWDSPIAAFLALPFVVGYDSIAQPATLTVIGHTLHERHRTMAISLQSIQRRVPRIVAYLSGGALVAAFGSIGGVRAAVAISASLVIIAFAVQLLHLQIQKRDTAPRTSNFSVSLLKRFPPDLRRLLIADILARVAEGMPRELYVIYAVIVSSDASAIHGDGFGVFGISSLVFGPLLALQAFTSMLTYIPVGWLAARTGKKQPFIALTFLFFALFPIAFWWLGHELGVAGLIIAYVIAGLREIGEPARKAMITELVPNDAKTAATGLYWATRTFAVMLAPLFGAILWLSVSPAATFITASAFGIVGAVAFALIFRRRSQEVAAH